MRYWHSCLRRSTAQPGKSGEMKLLYRLLYFEKKLSSPRYPAMVTTSSQYLLVDVLSMMMTWQVTSNDLINYLNSTLSLSSTILESPLTWRSFRFPSSSFYLPEWWCRVPLWRLSGIPQHTCLHWEPDRFHFLITKKLIYQCCGSV